MMDEAMGQEMEEQIREAIDTVFYGYIQEVTGPRRMGRYKEVECKAIAAVTKCIDSWIDCDEQNNAFFSDDESRQVFNIKAKSADLVRAHREGRFRQRSSPDDGGKVTALRKKGA